jgi:COP9 signalosome complex subunit 6
VLAAQLVLINISDHCTRTRANSGDTGAHVLGILLGSQVGRSVDISNSFEIKWERDAQGAIQIDQAFLVHKQEQCQWQGRRFMHATY